MSEVLNDTDRQSAAWQKLKAHLEAELVRLRRKNDADLPDIATARLRGQIAQTKYLLGLGEAKPPLKTED